MRARMPEAIPAPGGVSLTPTSRADKIPGRADDETPMSESSPAAAVRGATRSVASFDPWILGILVAGLLIRLPFLPHIYYEPDISYWKSWLAYSTANGIHQVYALELPGQTYPPLLLYVLWLLGSLYLRLWRPEDSPLLTAIVKIPAVVGDLVVALLLCVFARHLWAHLSPARPLAAGGRFSPRVAAAILAFHPTLIWNSSLWGQFDVVIGGIACVAWFLLLSGSTWRAGALLAAGVLTKPQGLIILPAAAALLAARSGAMGIVKAILAGASVCAIVTLPFVVSGHAGKLAGIYAGAGGVYPYLSVNAYNPWWIYIAAFGGGRSCLEFRDDAPIAGFVGAHHVGLVLFMAATAWIVWRSWLLGRGDATGFSSRAWRLLTLQWLAFFLLPTQIHERYLFPALISMAPVVLLERRWRWVYGLLSLGVLLNLMLIAPATRTIFAISQTLSGRGILAALAFTAIAAALALAEIRDGRSAAGSARIRPRPSSDGPRGSTARSEPSTAPARGSAGDPPVEGER